MASDPLIQTGIGCPAAIRLKDLTSDQSSELLARLVRAIGAEGFRVQREEQLEAWRQQIALLVNLASRISGEDVRHGEWHCCLEYSVPRRGRRIDAVILCPHAIVPVEFKFGAATFTRADQQQVEDYGLELADFHSESQNSLIVPVLVATKAVASQTSLQRDASIGVASVQLSTVGELCQNLLKINEWSRRVSAPRVIAEQWLQGVYRPTPTVIEAAQVLYAGHDVREIARTEAGAKNLHSTQTAIRSAIDHARSASRKIICFVTGVPGAGKTLAGLNAVHGITGDSSLDTNAVFLSGNSPLVRVLTEALARSDSARTGANKRESRRRASTEIQNVHAFIQLYSTEDQSAPFEPAIVFDEAQRAWDADQSFKKFRREESEPETLMRIMDRRTDWAAIVALVGGGQEIHNGEAGLGEWGRVIVSRFPHWEVFVSDRLLVGEASTVQQTLFSQVPKDIRIQQDSDLHLNVSIRSFRSASVSHWVDAVLSGESGRARELMSKLSRYPINLTRSLGVARRWLLTQTRGLRRSGLVASSESKRLRPEGLDVRNRLDVESWFLEGEDDVRSSLFLELPATEFEIQGLELDWCGLCWDADLRWAESGWEYWKFVGSRWRRVRKPRNQQYLINKYRVLLTRAREGVVIFVPEGDTSGRDHTRDPRFYDGTAEYLQECGIALI